MAIAVKVVKVEAVEEQVEEQVAESQGIVAKKTLKETCVHHWLIEEAKKPTSTGICKKCHAVKEFNNYIGDRSEFTRSPKPYGRKTR